MEYEFKPSVQPQRRVNPNIKEVVKKEVIKLLDARLIYPISDSPWVSPVQVVLKKGGMTVVKNEKDELISQRTVTRWRVCIDYHKLNNATQKDHFRLLFIDQMLERQAGHEYYCFLDRFSGYFQIPIALEDQEKTMFTCPYGTFACKRMPFGLCNAPTTFQRYMTTIFHKLIKYSIEEGIVLSHKVSGSGIEVDKAKIEAISKLPYPMNVKAIRRFLGHEFYIEIRDKKGAKNLVADHFSRLENPDLGKLTKAEIRDLFPEEQLMAISDKNNEPCVLTESYEDAWSEMRQHKFFDNVTADHPEDIMASPLPQEKSSRSGFTGHISFAKHVSWSRFAMHVSEQENFCQGTKHLRTPRLYLMRRSLEVLRKFHWMILGGRFNQLSHGVVELLEEVPYDNRNIRPTKDFEAKYNKVKAKLALLSSSASVSKAPMVKNKGLIAEAYEWDEEEMSSNDNEMVEVKLLMALAEENEAVSKESARNGEWVKISMRKLSKAEGFILPNHDTGMILLAESQRNITDPSVAVSDSSMTDYDSADESLVCSTPFPPLKKLEGSEPISGPKTIKSILKSKSTLKAEALKAVIINEPSSTPAKGNKSSSASKVHSAPAGKLTSVKIEDDPPLALVMKELNSLKLHVRKNQSSYPRNNQCEKIDQRTCDHTEYISTMNMSQHLKSLGRAFSRSQIPRPSKRFFPPCTHCGGLDHLSNECLYYPVYRLCGSYDHDINGHNRIISLEREINLRNPQHPFKRCKVCGSSTHTITDHYDIEWFKRGEALQAKKVEALRSTRAESSNANRSKTPTKRILLAKASENLNWLWHKRLAHLNFKTINKLAKQNLLIGLPSLVYSKDKPCSSCEKGKHHRASFKTKQTSSIKKCLHLLHMDLFGPITPRSIKHEKYTLVIVDEYSRNGILVNFCDKKRISQNFYSPYTPEQNGVAERKNRTLIEAARTSFQDLYQTNSNDVSFIEPYECPELVVLETKVSSEQNGQTDQKDQSVQNDEILNDYHYEHSNHTNDEQIIDNLPNTEDIQISEHLSSPSVEDTSAQNTIPIPPPLPTPSMITPAPQDRWSQDKHIELVNNIGNPRAGMLIRAMAKQISAASAHECLFVDFLSEEEPKKIKQSKRGISIYQEKYVKDLLKNYNINGSLVKTAMVPPNNLRHDLNGKAINETQYRGMIGSLMYLTTSRPDIQFLTCLCVRYQANPKESHLIDVKRILRYLKGTPSLGLWYPKCSGFDLKGYSDSDYAGCNMDRKSTSAAAGCSANIVWMKSQLTDYDIIYEKVPIFCDNTSAIAISNNPVLHSRTKHIDIRYHFIRDHILKGDIELHFIPTQYQLADIFTKPLDEPTFKRLIVELGEVRGEIGITTFRNALRAQYLHHSSIYVSPPSITIVEVADQISNKDATILYCLANSIQVDYAKIIWEGLIHKLNKKTREKIIPYPRFISLLLEHMAPKYDTEKLTINQTQFFSVHNWILKPNQPQEPPFTDHMKAICNLDVPVDSKAPKYSSPIKEKETKSSSAKDTSPSHPSPSTPVVGVMHKETQQAADGPTSLGATSEEGAHPQLSSVDSTAKANPDIYAPSDFVPQQRGMNEGTKNTSYDHIIAGSNPSVLVNKTKSARDGLKTAHTSTNEESRVDDITQKVKLEDLSDILKDTRSAFFTLDSPTDEPIIISDESEEDEESQKEELEHAKVKAEAEVASMKAKPLYPNIYQLTELLVTSLKPKLSKLFASHEFASCLLIELKELPSKITELSGEIKELKQHVRDMEIELPGDLVEIPTKLETFTSTIYSLLSQVAELKNIQWKLPTEFLNLPSQVSSV
ncbi:retrovirus-related pol polyprotein from transposon TNT 1-94 [Tanacetum coccineum]